MRMDDFRKLATGSVLFNLDRIIAPRIVTILYLLGLAGIALWAVNHLFFSFRFGFGNGLWGIVEIAIFGLLAFVVLRIACEMVIVYFKAHSAEAAEATRPRPSASLIDEIRDAIEDLADQEVDVDDDDPLSGYKVRPLPPEPTRTPPPATPATPPATPMAPAAAVPPHPPAPPATPDVAAAPAATPETLAAPEPEPKLSPATQPGQSATIETDPAPEAPPVEPSPADKDRAG